MNNTVRNSYCILRSLCKSKPNWITQAVTVSRNGLHRNNKSLCFSRQLTSGHSPSKQEAQDNARTAIKSLFQSGLGTKDCVEGYSTSGKDYEEHMGTLDFSGPRKMAEIAASILKDNKGAKILDVGAGSGLGGVSLQQLGYTNLDAVDASEGLLKLAETKNIYGKVMCHFLGKDPMPVADELYDMIVLCGAMQENHLPTEAFDDLIRVVKPGGHIVNVFREAALTVPWYGDGLENYFAEQEKMGRWKMLDKIYFPNFLAGVEGVALVHQVV